MGVVSRGHSTSRNLGDGLCCVCLPALGPLETCSVVSVRGCVNDAKEQAAAE